jgi:putative ABC transport system permease protein
LSALGLAAVSAAVAGVIPAWRVTGRAVQENIQRAQAGRTGVRFGGISTALLVGDVAVAMGVVGLTVALQQQVRSSMMSTEAVGIPAEEYLAVRLQVPSPPGVMASPESLDQFRVRLAATQQAVEDRLANEPGVRGVAVATALPRMDHTIAWVETEDDPLAEGQRGAQIRTVQVDLDYFDALEQPILAGRGFDAGDLGEDGSAILVDTTFVSQVLGGRNPIGQRVRYRIWNRPDPTPWYQIVGVVGSLGMHVLSHEGSAGLYHPLAPGQANPVWLGVHATGDPTTLIPAVRSVVASVDLTAVVTSPRALDKVYEGDWYVLVGVAGGAMLLVVILLALATSGIYAIMSFAVSERALEIGIRSALGAQRLDILRAIARRALFQLGLGVLVGLPVAWRIFLELERNGGGRTPTVMSALLALGLGAGVMAVVGLLACTGPTLRALRIEPRRALDEGG